MVRLARFTLKDHVYGASRLPKTTVLQSKIENIQLDNPKDLIISTFPQSVDPLDFQISKFVNNSMMYATYTWTTDSIFILDIVFTFRLNSVQGFGVKNSMFKLENCRLDGLYCICQENILNNFFLSIFMVPSSLSRQCNVDFFFVLINYSSFCNYIIVNVATIQLRYNTKLCDNSNKNVEECK